MSLDVYLEGDARDRECMCAQCGHQHTRTEVEEFYWSNITHNLGAMAREAGIYMHLWRPDEIGVTRALELVAPLRAGLARLEADPAHFQTFNAPNGWGTYEHFVPFVRAYLRACEESP